MEIRVGKSECELGHFGKLVEKEIVDRGLELFLFPGLDRLNVDRVLQLEIAASEAVQTVERGAASERVADIGAECADIRAFRAGHGEVDVRQFEALERDGMDRDGLLFALHLDALPRQVVQAFAVVLHGGHHRRRLHNVALELQERLADLFDREVRCVGGGDDRAVHVLRIGPRAEQRGSLVDLVLAGELLAELGELAEHDHEQSGRRRVERAAMAHLHSVEPLAEEPDDVVTGPALRLVDEEDAVLGERRQAVAVRVIFHGSSLF